jgi:hypothetical protein
MFAAHPQTAGAETDQRLSDRVNSALSRRTSAFPIDRDPAAPLSDAELAVRHSERGGDCRVIHTIHADQLLARACPADYRDFRWSDPELLRDKATQSLVRATVVRRCRHSSDDIQSQVGCSGVTA